MRKELGAILFESITLLIIIGLSYILHYFIGKDFTTNSFIAMFVGYQIVVNSKRWLDL